VVSDPVLNQEFESGRGQRFLWPRLVSGESYLRASTPLATKKRVAVIGGGPTAAWAVERAQSGGCLVLWVSLCGLNGAFLASRRNDHLALPPLTRSRTRGRYVVDTPLFPSDMHTRFGEYIDIDSIS